MIDVVKSTLKIFKVKILILTLCYLSVGFIGLGALHNIRVYLSIWALPLTGFFFVVGVIFFYSRQYLFMLKNLTWIDYINYKGERGFYHIYPIRLWKGYNKYHLGYQWFLEAYKKDGDTDNLLLRNFALKDVQTFAHSLTHWLKKWNEESYANSSRGQL